MCGLAMVLFCISAITGIYVAFAGAATQRRLKRPEWYKNDK